MQGELDLISVSDYKDLIEALDALYTVQKLTGKKMLEPYVTFHDQAVNGRFGWNVFFADVKINLGLHDTRDNKMIITIRKLVDESFLIKLLTKEFNEISCYNDVINGKTVITLGINSNIDEEFMGKILRIIDLSHNI